MYSKTSKQVSLKEISSYTLPKLHIGKNWYVDFCYLDPATKGMNRKKYMFNNIEKITERRKMAAEIIANVTHRLRSGWNHWAEISNSRQYTKWKDTILFYKRYLEKLYTTKVIKESTLTDYQKRIGVLNEYNQNLPIPITYMNAQKKAEFFAPP